jgi:hypothetical protein
MRGPRSSAEGARPHLLPRAAFVRRAGGFLLFGLGGLVLSLALGAAGYRWVAGLSWVDAVFNAAMILTGMGPADPMPTSTAKIFASLYAIYAGLAWTALTGVILYPFIHRMLVALHLQLRGDDD